jgi:hypothetical protein
VTAVLRSMESRFPVCLPTPLQPAMNSLAITVQRVHINQKPFFITGMPVRDPEKPAI